MEEIHFFPVAIEPKIAYGIRTEVVGNINFNIQQEVIYPVEGVIAFHDYVKNKQRFLKLPPGTTPTVIKLNSTKLLMAIVEILTTEDQQCITNIVVYDVGTLKKIRVFDLPTTAHNKRVTKISFTCDSNALVILTSYPDEMLYILNFDRQATVTEGRAGNANHRGMASFISCNPALPDHVAVCGDGVMKLMVKSDKGFSFCTDIKPEFNATSVAWISSEMFFVGTQHAVLILYENGTQQTTYRAKDVETINLKNVGDLEDQSPQEPISTSDKSQAIVCMTAFSKGLAYAIFNQVYVFEKISKSRYERKTILNIPTDNYPEDSYQITNLAINAKQDTVIVTPRHSQIYVGILIVPESLKTKRLEFRTLGQLIHVDLIQNIGVCSWRPIVVSASKDKTIRVWNYLKEKVELVKHFPQEVSIIELFASGQYAVVGFVDKVQIMQIFMDDLSVVKTYNFSNVSDIQFSYLGHLLAVAYESTISIISIFNLETLRHLKGHVGTVVAIAWSRNDKSVFSSSDDGVIYEWDVDTGDRLQEIIHPGTKYTALCVPSDPNVFYAATESGILKEIKGSQVVREIKIPFKDSLADITLSRSDLVMFAATKAGRLYNIHMPLSTSYGGTLTMYPFFDTAITNIRITYDGKLLISTSASGTLVIWNIKNIEGKVAPIDQDLLKSQEVLIPRRELEEKNERVRALEMQLKQQAAEFYQKQTQSEENEQEQIAETHKGYCEALAEMKAKNEEIAVRHANELTQITSQIDELNAEHKTYMESLAAQYSERMLMEYQKFATLRETMLKIRDSYEEKLRESKGCLHDTVEALDCDFRNQLEERQELVRQLMQDMDEKKLEFHDYCHQVEIDNDRKMIDCQIGYEKKAKYERDETQKWRNEADSHQFKYNTIKKECDSLFDEANKLRETHYKSKAMIAQLRDDIKDLNKDVADREEAIVVKEKRIDEILLKNQDLEKYKKVLNHKINELKAQIEPRELQIIEKRKQITEMEQELNGLQKNNLQLELQLKELKDKLISVNVELKTERSRAKSAKLCVTSICTEIYQVAEGLNSPEKLSKGIKILFRKYSNDEALKPFVTLDTQTQAILYKQRDNIERIMFGCKRKMHANLFSGRSKKLEADNKLLTEEVQDVRRQNNNLKRELKNMDDLVKICTKIKPIHDVKPTDTLVEIERINKYFEDRVTNLATDVNTLARQNEKLREDLERKRMNK